MVEQNTQKRDKKPLSQNPEAIRKRNSRLKIQIAIEAQTISSEEISTTWSRYEALLKNEDPALHAKLLERHEFVTGLEEEVSEIVEGVANGLHAETRTLATADSKEIFPMPDLCFA